MKSSTPTEDCHMLSQSCSQRLCFYWLVAGMRENSWYSIGLKECCTHTTLDTRGFLTKFSVSVKDPDALNWLESLLIN